MNYLWSFHVSSPSFVEINNHLLSEIFCKTVTVVSAERSFSTLKLIKTFNRSTTREDRLSLLAMIAIESETARKLDTMTYLNESQRKNKKTVTLNTNSAFSHAAICSFFVFRQVIGTYKNKYHNRSIFRMVERIMTILFHRYVLLVSIAFSKTE